MQTAASHGIRHIASELSVRFSGVHIRAAGPVTERVHQRLGEHALDQVGLHVALADDELMLLDKTTDLTPEERVDRAFRYDTLPEKAEEFRQNMELFHDYVRGGIEAMYEQFTDGC